MSTKYRRIGFLPDGATGMPSSFMTFRSDTLEANGYGPDAVITSTATVNELLGQDIARFIADYEVYIDGLVPGDEDTVVAVREAMKDEKLGRIKAFLESWNETQNINHLQAALDAKMSLSVDRLGLS